MNEPTHDIDFLESAHRTINSEIEAIRQMKSQLDAAFVSACQLILKSQGRVVVTGMGKSGHIGHKLAATLASTGTPAFFVHPGDAGHGDLGMITPSDIVIAISNSGNADEIRTLLPILRRLNVPMISLTGNPESTIAKAADINIHVGVDHEACPLGLAPTSSTTAALVMGDALAVALLEARGFTPEDFALSHPGGTLGRRLLLRVEDIMRSGKDVPVVDEKVTLSAALAEMTAKTLGMTTVVGKNDQLLGIFTDGDLRRAVDKGASINKTLIREVMTKKPKTITVDTLAATALSDMESMKITTLVVTSSDHKPVGVLHLHDLLRAGLN